MNVLNQAEAIPNYLSKKSFESVLHMRNVKDVRPKTYCTIQKYATAVSCMKTIQAFRERD